jgi:SNF2 family DNA or RNA helicase
MEEQVVSRAHRMGATRPIHVETLAMRGTIEEQMLRFLQVGYRLVFSGIFYFDFLL